MKRRPVQERNEEEESFLSRWSRCKLESGRQDELQPPAAQQQEAEEEPPCDEDMPPLESLDEESDYRGFLSPNVSESLRRLALRRLFHSPQFNVCDGLDDYAEDFTCFTPLGELVTAEMRRRMGNAVENLEMDAGGKNAGRPQEKQSDEQSVLAQEETKDDEIEDDEEVG